MAEAASTAASLHLGAQECIARQAAETPGVISFAGGLPDASLFPKEDLCRAFLSALDGRTAALQYSWPEGLPDLRAWVAERLCRRGARVAPEHVIITSGAQQAILLALASAPRHARIGMNAESYPGAFAAFHGRRARLVGLDTRADLYYVMPSVSNPNGQRMSGDSRAELLRRLARHDAYAIEDDAYEATSFDSVASRPLLADARDRVFHVGTFSKTLCPGLRIGWLVPPTALAKRALTRKQTQDLQANGLTQALLSDYLQHADFEQLVRRANRLYAKKARLLMSATARHLPQFRFREPRGGFSLWLESDLRCDEDALLRSALERKVSFDLGSPFRRHARPNLALRLCFSSVVADQIDTGVARLSNAVAAVAQSA